MDPVTTTTEALESRKRPRAESIEKGKDDASEDTKKRVSDPGTKPKGGESTPAYGSQEYWEERYKEKTDGETRENEDDPDPYHAWYFKFDDLAPILMPLILGSAANDDDNDDDSEQIIEGENGDETEKKTTDSNQEDSSSQVVTQKTTDGSGSNEAPAKQPSQEGIENVESDNVEQKTESPDVEQSDDEEGSGTGSDDEIEGFDIVAEMDEEDEDEKSAMVRVGLATKGPISVLEVGCGDAPLGQDLASSIENYGAKSGRDPSTILQKVVCLDYSKNVINTMKQIQQEQEPPNSKEKVMIPVHYEVGDARKLIYENESFEVILEKGTLDAMLSDSDGLGQKNCRKIVSECARVLTIGGYIIIISHLNAHVESGLEWLNNVIVPGLRAAGNFEWLIEVHGSDVEIPSDVDSETEEGTEKQIESPGPAVYFIEKVGSLPQAKASDNDGNQPLPSIPLKFFSY